MIYLIQYDRAKGKVLLLKEYLAASVKDANEDRLQLELGSHEIGSNMEVVTIEAGSLDQLMRTHRRYFETIESLVNPDGPNINRKEV